MKFKQLAIAALFTASAAAIRQSADSESKNETNQPTEEVPAPAPQKNIINEALSIHLDNIEEGKGVLESMVDQTSFDFSRFDEKIAKLGLAIQSASSLSGDELAWVSKYLNEINGEIKPLAPSNNNMAFRHSMNRGNDNSQESQIYRGLQQRNPELLKEIEEVYDLLSQLKRNLDNS